MTTVNALTPKSTITPTLLSESAKQCASMNTGCGVCERRGVPLYLVRKAVVPKSMNVKVAGILPLSEREPTESLSGHDYVYRSLRKGYVYVRLQNINTGLIDFEIYQVTRRGLLRCHTHSAGYGGSIKEVAPRCVKDNHCLPAMFLDINTELYSHAWVAYDESEWSQSALSHYKALDADVTRFTALDLAATQIKHVATDRSFAFNELMSGERTLLEMQLTDAQVGYYYDKVNTKGDKSANAQEKEEHTIADSILHEIILAQRSNNQDLYYSEAPFFSLIDAKSDGSNKHHTEKDKLECYIPTISKRSPFVNSENKPDVAVVVVDDYFGIAKELTVQRRIRLSPYVESMKNAQNAMASSMAESYAKAHIPKFDLSNNAVLRKAMSKSVGHQSALHQALMAESEEDLLENKALDDSMLADVLDGRQDSSMIMIRYWLARKNRTELINSYLKGLTITSEQDYFHPDMIYMREISSCIEQYKEMVYRRAELDNVNTEPDTRIALYDKDNKIVALVGATDEVFVGSLNPYLHSGTSHYNTYPKAVSKPYEPDSYGQAEEVPLTATEEVHYRVRCANKLGYSYYPALTLKKYIYRDSLKRIIKRDADKEWAKHTRHLNLGSYDTFQKKNEQAYGLLQEKIAKLSEDYYHYVNWLFALNDDTFPLPNKTFQILPVATGKMCPISSRNNPVKSWVIEHPADCSDGHLQLIHSVTMVLDSGFLGSLLEEKRFAISRGLIANEDSIYWHLFDGGTAEKSFWSQYLAEQKAISAGKQSINTIKKWANFSIGQYSTSNAHLSLAANLYQGLFQSVVSGINNAPVSGGFIQSLRYEKHLFDAVRFFGAGSEAIMVDVKVQARDIPLLMTKVSEQGRYFTANKTETVGGMTATKLDVGGWTIAEKQSAKLDEVVTVRYSAVVGSAQEGNELIESLQGKHSVNVVTDKLGHRVISVGQEGLTDEQIQTIWNDTKLKQQAIVVDSTVELVLNVATLAINYDVLRHNLSALESTSLDESLRNKLRLSIADNSYKFGALSIKTLITAINLGNHLSFYSLQAEIVAAVGSTKGVMTCVGSIIGVIDGFLSLVKGVNAVSNENRGAMAYVIGSVISLVLVGLDILSLFYVIPGLGYIAFIFGIISSLLIAVFDDSSDTWSPMELWFNRCCFGQLDHLEKGAPYALTGLGMAIALKEFFFASRGGMIIMQFNDETVLFRHNAAGLQVLEENAIAREAIPSPNKAISDYIFGVYLNIQLPDYEVGKSLFRGSVHIVSTSPRQPNEIFLKVQSDKEGQLMLVQDTLPLESSNKIKPYFIQQPYNEFAEPIPKPRKDVWHGINAAQKKDDEGIIDSELDIRNSQKNMNSGDAEFDDSEKENTGPGLMQIYHKLGEFSGYFSLTCHLLYWVDGEMVTDKHNKTTAQLPLVIDYEYKG